MQSPLFNLIVRGASGLSVLLTVTAAALVAMQFAGVMSNAAAVLAAMVAAATLSVFTTVVLIVESSRSRTEILRALEAAHDLSRGKPPEVSGDSELLDSLRMAGVYLLGKSQVVERMTAGEIPSVPEPDSDADVLGISLSALAEYLTAVETQRNSSESMQRSVMKLLGEVSSIASGDLTIQADLDPGVTGEIAGAFNAMTGSLRVLIGRVKAVSTRIALSADIMIETADKIECGSSSQASEITKARRSAEELASRIGEIADKAGTSASTAAESLERARQGRRAAEDNITAAASIRRQVNETAKRIKRLGERVQEMGQLTAQIEDLSDKTSLLALNASLRSTAETAYGGSASVAVDVERLAERCSTLSQQLASITQMVNLELADVASSMDETITQVVTGSTQAEKAAVHLARIEEVAVDLSSMASFISEASGRQRKSAEQLFHGIASISAVNKMAEAESRRSADSVRTLVELADQLKNAVAPFKLPPEARPLSAGPARTDAFVN